MSVHSSICKYVLRYVYTYKHAHTVPSVYVKEESHHRERELTMSSFAGEVSYPILGEALREVVSLTRLGFILVAGNCSRPEEQSIRSPFLSQSFRQSFRD